MAVSRVRRAGQEGFTLLELLVAMTLFALLSAILVGGFRFGARVWERAEATAAEVTEVESAQAVIRRLITSALPIPHNTQDGDFATEFWGDLDTMSFVGPAPAQAFTGGLHTISLLRLPMRGGGLRLVLNVRPYDPDAVAPSPRSRRAGSESSLDKTVVLVEGAAAIEFLYFGGDEEGAPPRWQPTWVKRPALPQLMAVNVTFPPGDRRVWPDLVAGPVILEAGF